MNDAYQIIYADPPWRFKNWSMKNFAQYGERWQKLEGMPTYPVMTKEDIAAMPVGDIAARNSLLLMWTTSPMIADGTSDAVMRAWGFVPVTIGFTWVKLNPSGVGWHFGLGYHTRQNAEYVFIARRGRGLSQIAKDVFSLVLYPRGRHSAKPPIIRDRIERLYGDVNRVELFARETVSGWDCYGNEVICSEGTAPLFNYLVPPIETIIDEDEYQGLPIIDTHQESWDLGEQIRLM